MTTTWPIFEIHVPCPGHPALRHNPTTGRLEHVVLRCEEDRECWQEVSFDELRLRVWYCYGIACDSELRQETINECLEEHYGPVVHRTRTISTMYAWKNRSHAYRWHFCDCGAVLKEWWQTNQKHWKVANKAKMNPDAYCSWACCAKAHGACCDVCGQPVRPLRGVTARRYWNSRTGTQREIACGGRHIVFAERYLAQHDSGIGYLRETYGTYCSRQCCSLALEEAIRREREDRQKQRELSCVRKVKALLPRVRKSLRDRPNPEVWRTLQGELQQAAILQE